MHERQIVEATRTFEAPGLRIVDHAQLGRGVVTDRVFERGETIAIWRGREISGEYAVSLSAAEREQLLQIGHDTFLYTHLDERCTVDFINHSCDPNCGFSDAVTLVTMRRIELGEAVTFDYAMSDCNSFVAFACRCGASRCRGRLTRDDWRIPDLQSRYDGWLAPHINALVHGDG